MIIEDVGQPGKLELLTGEGDESQEEVVAPDPIAQVQRQQKAIELHSEEIDERELLAQEQADGTVESSKLEETSSLLDQIAYPGNRVRSEVARLIGRIGLSRGGVTPETIPDELTGHQLLTEVFDFEFPEGMAPFQPNPAKPWLPQAVEFVSKVPGSLLRFQNAIAAEVLAETTTDPLNLLGIGLMSKMRRILQPKKTNKEIARDREQADTIQKALAGLDVRKVGKDFQQRLAELKTRDPGLEARAAKALKNDPDFAKKLQGIQPNTVLNDADLTASMMLVESKAQQINDVIQKFGPEAFRDPKAGKALVEELAGLAALLAPKKSIDSAVGASLKSLDSIENQARKQFIKQYEDLLSKGLIDPSAVAKQIALFDSSADMARFAHQLSKPGWQQMYNELLINSLLSGPVTFGVNIAGNGLAYMQHLSNRQVAGLFGRGGVPIGEAGRMLMASVGAIGEASRMAWKVFKAGRKDLDRIVQKGEAKLDIPQFGAITAENFPKAWNIMRGPIDWLGAAVRIPTRLLMAQDEFMKGIMYQGELVAQAGRLAANTPDYRALSLAGRAARREDILQQMVDTPDAFKGAHQAAQHTALENTFMARLGEQGESIVNITNKNAYLKMLVPFVRTPINILKRTANDLPIGMRSHKKLRDALKSPDKAIRDEARGRLAFSGMVAAFFANLTMDGTISLGRGPNNPKLQKVQRDLQGRVQGSLAFDTDGDGVADKFIGINTRTAFGQTLNLIGSFTESLAFIQEDNPEAAEQMATEMVLSIADLLVQVPFVQPLGDLATLITRVKREGVAGMEDHIKRMAPTYLLPVLGGLRGQVRRQADLTKREVGPLDDLETLFNGVINQTPGASTSLPAIHDLFGNEETYPVGLAPDFVQNMAFGRMLMTFIPGMNLLTESKDRPKDEMAIAQWMLDQEVIIPPPRKKISGIEIPHDLYQQWMKAAGKGTITGESMAKRLMEVVKNPEPELVLLSNGSSEREDVIEFKAIVREQYNETLEELLDSPEWKGVMQQIEALEEEEPSKEMSTNRIQRKVQGIKLKI